MQQSYTLQVQRILQPIFARLGVYHEARNYGQGGLGTLQNSLSVQSLYGTDIDMLLWDSGMTEKNNGQGIEMMARQALLGRYKIPILLNFPIHIMRPLFQASITITNSTTDKGDEEDNNKVSELEFAMLGSGMDGIKKAQTFEDLETIPYAARYMKCASEIQKDFCKPNRYSGVCWIDRDDYTPKKKQDKYPGGRASWHPGDREHQLVGRVWTMMILQVLSDVLVEWKEYVDSLASDENNDGTTTATTTSDLIPIPPDDTWHMTEYYNSIRETMQTIGMKGVGECKKFNSKYLPTDIICNYPVKVSLKSITFVIRALPE